MRAFVIHHNPDRAKYSDYAADPRDPIASAKALLDAGDRHWVAGNCWRRMHAGDAVLFKFGGRNLRAPAGGYFAGWITASPSPDSTGTWRFRFRGDERSTRRLMKAPIAADVLDELVGRSSGASVQEVPPEKVEALLRMLPHLRRWDPATLLEWRSEVTHGLPIRADPLERILKGHKTWELRGRRTQLRGRIGLIESGSGLVVGMAELVDVVGPLRPIDLARSEPSWSEVRTLPYEKTFGWVLQNVKRLRHPVRYRHPNGAVVWVRLKPSTRRELSSAKT